MNADREADPLKQRVWQLKRHISNGLRKNEITEAVKVKLRYAAQKRPSLFGDYATL